MAKKSALAFVEDGYAQVEPNRLTAMINGEMESQAPAVDAATGLAMKTPAGETYLENGRFVCLAVDTTAAQVSPMGRIAVTPGDAITLGGDANDEVYMIYSERKVYDEREAAIDFADKAADKVDGFCYPRLFKLTAGDVFTTNCINAAAGALVLNTKLYIGDDGYLTTTAGTNTRFVFKITKVYTMPSGQPGVKLLVENNM